MPDAQTTQGYVVSGRYRLVRRLGEGGMGAVWLADHVTLRSKVAVKLLHPAVLDTDDGERRFLREAQAAAMLRSPHVVQILDHGVDGGTPYIVMELLEGESLAARLARVKKLSLPQTARLVTHVARAIGKAHDAGIVHRDLKPDNVFIVHNDDEEVAKVLDFGIAKMDSPLLEPATKISTREGSILGTPLYMSPEQVRGYGVDWRSDLWSLAIIAFECACGSGPFAGRAVGDLLVRICSEPLPVPSKVAPVPPSFDAWFAKAASRDVEKRFQSAKEMAEALRAISGEEPRAASFGAPPAVVRGAAREDPHVAAAETTDRLSPDMAVGETDRLSPDTGAQRREPDPSADTARLDEGARAPDHARTLATGGTMGGSATSPVALPRPRPLRSTSLLAFVIVAGVLGIAAWLAVAGNSARGTDVAAGSTTERPRPPVAPASSGGLASEPSTQAPEPARALSVASAPPAEPSATASAHPPAASSARAPERAASPIGSTALPAPRPHASSSASPRTPPHASDELTF